jgi:WD40 repeat protein
LVFLAFPTTGPTPVKAQDGGVTPIHTLDFGAEVASVAFSPVERILAAAGSSQYISLWEAATGTEVRILDEVDTINVSSVAFSPQGRLLASASFSIEHLSPRISFWEVRTGTTVRTIFSPTESIGPIAFSPDGRLLAVGSCESGEFLTCGGVMIKLWDVATGSEVRTLTGHTEAVTSVAFSPNGRLLASGSTDETATIWDVATGSTVFILRGHDRGVNAVAFHPDGRLLASASEDETIRLWDVATGRLVREIESNSPFFSPFTSVAFSPNGRLLASGSGDGTVKIWDGATGNVHTLSGHEAWVSAVAFSRDERLLASGSEDHTVKLWLVADLLAR